jgi:hypothetical protein
MLIRITNVVENRHEKEKVVVMRVDYVLKVQTLLRH